MDACPDLETLAGYLDGRLTERERADIAAHVAGCETCYFVFTEAAQTRASDRARAETDASTSPEPVTVPTPKWRMTPKVMWSSAAGLAAAAALVVAIETGFLPSARGDSAELRALVVAVGTDRTIDARITGGFAYGPVRAPVRSGEQPTAASGSPDIRIAAARIEKEATAHRSPQTLHRLGIAYLVTGDISRAVNVLEEAAGGSTDARVLSDLAAAYLARAGRTNDRQDLMKALSTVERALGADARLAEAWFNRAEALERLGLAAQALEAWQQYLQIDAQTAWASEARLHLAALAGR